MKKSVLVTGVGGFVGKQIAKKLLKQGYEITGVVRQKGEQFYPFKVIECDLAETINIENYFDVIVHAAGSVPYKKNNFMQFKRNNIDAMENLLDFAKRQQIKRMVYLSTIAIYGEFREDLINENSDKINLDGYGLTKYAAECLLQENDLIEGISLRMPGIIGKESSGIWLSNTVEKFQRNEDVEIYSPEFQTKNFVWIQDLTQFVCNLIEAEKWKYNVVNLACKEGATVYDIVSEIKKMLKSESQIIIDNSLRKSFCLNSQRAAEMGYMSLSPLEIIQNYINVRNERA